MSDLITDVSTWQQDRADTASAESEKSQEQIKSEAEVDRLQTELKKAQNQLRRVNNSNSPPSTESDAYHALKKCRAKNKENYHDDEDGYDKSGKDENAQSDRMMIATTSKEDHTVEKCPCCGISEVDVKTETKKVVDIPQPIIATKKRVRYSKGRCSKGHNINTTPKTYQRNIFWPWHHDLSSTCSLQLSV